MIPNYDAERTVDRVNRNEAIILDVREPGEWTMGHIDGALHIPLGHLAQRRHELPQDKTIVCQCASGGRSLHAAKILAQAGYQVANLAGGIMAWQMRGYPVVA